MYITVRDLPGTEPGDPGTSPRRTGSRTPVPRVVWALGFVSLLTDISSESVAAILPLYLTVVLGLSPVAYGVLDGLHHGVTALVRIGGGWAADRGGHPKWVALVGYGLSCLSRFGLLVATGFGTIAAVVTADRVGKGLRTAPRDTMIATAADPDHLGHAFGVHRALDSMGAALGPVLAFALLWLVPDGYRAVLVVSLGFAVLGVALLGLLVPERPARASDGAEPARAAFRWADVADPRLVRLLVVAGGLALLTVGDGFVYLSLLDRGQFAAPWFPLLYVGTNVTYLLLAVPVGRLADRVGRARVLVLGHVALVGAYLCAAAPGTGPAATLAALTLLGAFYAATDGVIAALAAQLVPASVRASGIATAQTVVAVARLLSAVGFGLLWFLIGPQAALVLVAVALAGAVPLALRALGSVDARRAPR